MTQTEKNPHEHGSTDAVSDQTPKGAVSTPVDGVWMLQQDNPGPMTLEGTQTYWIPTRDGAIVVDPGDDDEEHQAALASHKIALILLTHFRRIITSIRPPLMRVPVIFGKLSGGSCILGA